SELSPFSSVYPINLKSLTCQPFKENRRNFFISFSSEKANPPDVIYFVCVIFQPLLIPFLLIEASVFLASHFLLILLCLFQCADMFYVLNPSHHTNKSTLVLITS